MTLSDIIARIEGRGVELPETRHFNRVLVLDRAHDELLTALDEATTEVALAHQMLKAAAMDHALDNVAGYEIEPATVKEEQENYLYELRERAKRGEA